MKNKIPISFFIYFMLTCLFACGLSSPSGFIASGIKETPSSERKCLHLDESACKADASSCFWAGNICEQLLRGSICSDFNNHSSQCINFSPSCQFDAANATCNKVVNGPNLPSVSIAVASYEKRHGYHEYLYESFKQQDYQGPLNLIVYDNATVPSPFFTALHDPRVTYKHTTQTPAQLSLGAKRNWLADNATGEIIVVFDDDDFYGSNYVSFMVNEMKKTGATLLRAKTWLMSHFNALGTDLEYHLVSPVGAPTGWGFAFVFKKSIMTSCQYDDVNRLEEDPLAACVDANVNMKMLSIVLDTPNKQPLMLKFESYTPKSVQPTYNWAGPGGSYLRFYGTPGSYRDPGQLYTKAQVLNMFSSQPALVNKYIDFYKAAGTP